MKKDRVTPPDEERRPLQTMSAAAQAAAQT
jgi:hypothetical protein